MQTDLKRIWWIASYPKSGSTWVRMFLNAYVTGFPLRINSAFQYATGDHTPHFFQLTSAIPINELPDVAAVYLRPAVLINFIFSSHSQHLTLKTHHANVTVQGIPLQPPELSVGAVYLSRDPRDVAVSFAEHVGRTIDEAIDLMGNNETLLHRPNRALFHWLMSWSSHVDSWTINFDGFPVTAVRYENLVDEPNEAFRAVLAGLGFHKINEERFDFALRETAFEHLRTLEEKDGFREKGQQERFFQRGRYGGWKDRLTMDQVQRIEDNHRHTMRRCGYEPVTEASPKPIDEATQPTDLVSQGA